MTALPEEASCSTFGWGRATEKRRVFDGFAFNGENDVLAARRRELTGVINGTAIVTTAVNFHGESKDPLYINTSDTFVHVNLGAYDFKVCEDNVSLSTDCRLAITKNSVARAIEQFHPTGNDFVIFSDVDEIPNRAAIRLFHQCDVPLVEGYAQKGEINVVRLASIAHYVFNTGCKYPESSWYHRRGPVVMRVTTMRTFGLRIFELGHMPNDDKLLRAALVYGPHASVYNYSSHQFILPCSAWHLSSFGGLDFVRKKVHDNKDASVVPTQEDLDKCIMNKEDGYMNAKLHHLSFPAHTYPQVPHALEEAPHIFRVFFARNHTTR